MSNPEKDQAARLERARQIGLFRYMLIRDASDATLTGRQRGALVRKLAAEAHTDPDGPLLCSRVQTPPRTPRSWCCHQLTVLGVRSPAHDRRGLIEPSLAHLLAHERNCPEYSDLRTTLHSSRKPLLDAPRDLPLKTGSTYGLPHD